MNRLQIVRATQLFATRQDAIDYIQLNRSSISGEPIVVKYGTATNPNIILGIGSVSGKYFIIDAGKINDDINKINDKLIELENEIDGNHGDLSALIAAIQVKLENVIISEGLNSDGTYIKQLGDTILKDANNGSDADKLLSKAIQDLIKGLVNGSVLTTPKISQKAENLIYTEIDKGIYAAVDLTYDQLKGSLIFSRAGYDDKEILIDLDNFFEDAGYDSATEEIWIKFVKPNGDVKEIRIPVRGLIDEWQPAINSDKTIVQEESAIILKKVTDTTVGKDLLYADVKIDNQSQNVLKKSSNGYLYVSGNSSDLYYDTTNKTLKDKIDEIVVSITNTLTASKTYTDEKLVEAKAYADTQDGLVLHNANDYTDTAIVDLKAYADNGKNDAMIYADNKATEAKAYADAQDVNVKAYADSKDAANLTAAKEYTDTKIVETKTYIDTQDAANLLNAKTYADTKDVINLNEAKTYADTKDATNLTAAKAYADAQDVNVKAYADSKDAATLTASKTYTDEKLVEAKSYTDSNIIQVKGEIDTNLTAAKDYADTKDTIVLGSAKTYTDTKLVEAKTYSDTNLTAAKAYSDSKLIDAKDYAKAQADLALVNAKAYTDSQTTSTLDTAKAYSDGQDATNLTAAKDYADTKDTIVLGSAKTYTDTKSTTTLDSAKTYSDTNLTAAKDYADTKDTIVLANAKAYSDGQDATNLTAAKTYSDGKLATEIQDRKDADTALKTQVDGLLAKTLNVTPTNSVNSVLTIVGDVSTIKNDVKISSAGGNILSIESDGLFASAKLEYDNTTGKLKLLTSNGLTSEADISINGLIEDATYDSATRSIIIKFKLTNGTTETVTIDLANLVQEWDVDNTVLDNNGKLPAVILTKAQQSAGGQDKLSADIIRLDAADNILVKENNGALYVKGTADNISYNNPPTTEFIKHSNVQEALTDLDTALKGIDGKIDGNSGDITNIINDLGNLTNRVSTNETNIGTLNTKVTSIDGRVTVLENKVSNIETSITNINTNITNLGTKIDNLTTEFNDYKHQNDINILNLTNQITNIGDTANDVKADVIIGGVVTNSGNTLELNKQGGTKISIDTSVLNQNVYVNSMVLNGSILTISRTDGQSISVDFSNLNINGGSF